MALVDRLMALEEPRIPVHIFFAAQSEIIRGALTVAQVKSFLNMDVAAKTEYDLLVATAPTGTSATALANKHYSLRSCIVSLCWLREGILNIRLPQKSEPS